jgi:hypothetical protein
MLTSIDDKMAALQVGPTDEENRMETVVLNIGGKRFTTFRHTILGVKEGLLTQFFSQNYYDWITDEGDYFFDRNPKLFVPILEFYRTGILPVSGGLSFSQLWREVSYFGLENVISKHQIEIDKNDDEMNSRYDISWASSLACRISPLLKRALDLNLLQFTIMIDTNGLYKGIPSILMKNSVDKKFWTEFCHSFAKAPPGSPDDFSREFLRNFDITSRNEKSSGSSVVSLTGVDGSEKSVESVSWVLFRLKTCRTKSKRLDFVDRRNEGRNGGSNNHVQLEMLISWQLEFCLPQTLTASKSGTRDGLFILN